MRQFFSEGRIRLRSEEDDLDDPLGLPEQLNDDKFRHSRSSSEKARRWSDDALQVSDIGVKSLLDWALLLFRRVQTVVRLLRMDNGNVSYWALTQPSF